MPSTTPNFGFTYPLSSDPLADGAGDIQDFATTADTTFADLLGGTTDQVLAKNSNTDMDFTWTTLQSSPVFALRGGSGQYLSNRLNMQYDAIANVLSSSATGNPAFLFPIWVPKDVTLDRVGVNCNTTVASSTVRLGLYAPDADGIPTDLLVDAGTISTATTGVKEISISQAVSAGLVFVAVRWSASSIGLTGYTQTLGGSTRATDILVPPDTTQAQTPTYAGGLNWRVTGISGSYPSTVSPSLSSTGNQWNTFVRIA